MGDLESVSLMGWIKNVLEVQVESLTVDKEFRWPLPVSPVGSLRAECWNSRLRTRPRWKRLDLTAECIRLRSFSFQQRNPTCTVLGQLEGGSVQKTQLGYPAGRTTPQSVPSTSVCVCPPVSEVIRTHHACLDPQPRRMRSGFLSHKNWWEWTPAFIGSFCVVPNGPRTARGQATQEKKYVNYT